ncbi:MAG: hypothetical protein GXY39_04510 [Actinomycetales bacterium]|nr:hypothetical protein [Actinomycetales bacterium]
MDLESIAWRQAGVVSRAQALAVMSEGQLRWLLHRRRWLTVFPGVYQTHTGPLSWTGRSWAALLHYGPHATLALDSAAFVLGIGRQEPHNVQIVLPQSVRRDPRPGVEVQRRRRVEWIQRRGQQLTAPAFTVIDLAAAPSASRDDAISIAARAVQKRIVTVEALAAELARRRAHPHRTALELSCGVIADGAESGLEVVYVDKVIRAHGLPPMRMNVPDRLGGSRIRRDFDNEEFGVVAEVDGVLGHEGFGRTLDARRDRKTLARGRVTARQTWVEVHYQACELAADLFGILRSRGYPGHYTRCSRTCSIERHLIVHMTS